MIFIFSLVIAALLCIASFICYKVSGKMLDEKDAEKCAKRCESQKNIMCSTRAFFCHLRTLTKNNIDQAHF